jgi:hypothetical protein
MRRSALLLACLALAACAPQTSAPQGALRGPEPACAVVEGLGTQAAPGAQRLDPDLWRGMTRAEILAMLEALPAARRGLEPWPALRRLVAGVLTAPLDVTFIAQDGTEPDDAPDLLTARLRALNGLGMHREAVALYETLDGAPCSAAQAQAGVEAMIGAGLGPLACVEVGALADSGLVDAGAGFWAKTAARCAPGAKRPLPDAPVPAPGKSEAPPEGGASVAQIAGALAAAHAAGQGLPRDWVAALDDLDMPTARAARRQVAVLQSTALISTPRGQAARRTKAIAAALDGDAKGQAMFAARVGPVMDALTPHAAPGAVDFAAGQGGASYVMPPYRAARNLDAMVQREVVAGTALAAALYLAGQEPGAAYPGVLHRAIAALAASGLATSAEGVATTALLGTVAKI